MSDKQGVDAGKLTIAQLLANLTAGQVSKLIAAAVTVFVVAFAVGVWTQDMRLARASQAKEANIIAITTHDRLMSDLAESHQLELASVVADNARLALQVEFLERCHAYLNARIEGKEDSLNGDWSENVSNARKQFAQALDRLYKRGDPNAQKAEGYEFDESEPGNHRITFGTTKTYRIPADVKGDFIDGL